MSETKKRLISAIVSNNLKAMNAMAEGKHMSLAERFETPANENLLEWLAEYNKKPQEDKSRLEAIYGDPNESMRLACFEGLKRSSYKKDPLCNNENPANEK